MATKHNCPQCGNPLYRVLNPSFSMLNDEQFAAVRAGDWYCSECKSDAAASGYKYYWDEDLPKNPEAARPTVGALEAARREGAVAALRYASEEAETMRCSDAFELRMQIASGELKPWEVK